MYGDLVLISASCADLRQMIEIGEQETSRLDNECEFNVKKSCLVRCGPIT